MAVGPVRPLVRWPGIDLEGARKTRKTAFCVLFYGFFCNEGDGVRTRNHRIDNPVTPCKTTGKNEVSADGRYTGATFDPDLAALMAAWPTLPAAVRQALAAMAAASAKA